MAKSGEPKWHVQTFGSWEPQMMESPPCSRTVIGPVGYTTCTGAIQIRPRSQRHKESSPHSSKGSRKERRPRQRRRLPPSPPLIDSNVFTIQCISSIMPPASRQKTATARPAHAHVKDHISLHELSVCSFLCSKTSVMFFVFVVYYTVPCVPDQISACC